jgi:hypothetical protein
MPDLGTLTCRSLEARSLNGKAPEPGKLAPIHQFWTFWALWGEEPASRRSAEVMIEMHLQAHVTHVMLVPAAEAAERYAGTGGVGRRARVSR